MHNTALLNFSNCFIQLCNILGYAFLQEYYGWQLVIFSNQSLQRWQYGESASLILHHPAFETGVRSVLAIKFRESALVDVFVVYTDYA